ncbi:MAG: secretin N-terminal domain-containing protein [Phycisphaerales bacterium]|nr:secretin N-terminal domain-containing protein [Phycisphaerales bacterium]
MVLSFIVVAVMPVRALAQPSPSIVPAGQVELARLVDLAAQQLALNIEYDATTLKGTATLRLDGGLSGEELWELTNRTLAARGFTTVRLPGRNAYGVVRLNEAANASRVWDLGSAPEGPRPGFECVVVQTSVRAARDLTDPVSKVLSKPGGSATALSDRGILLCDLSHRIDTALALLRVIDVAGTGVEVREVTLSSVSGNQAAVLATQVLTERDKSFLGGAGGKPLTPSGTVLIGADPRSVLVVAPPESVSWLVDLVRGFDRADAAMTMTYAPAHHTVADVAALIEQVMQPARGVQGSGAGAAARVVVDDLTQSLIVTASPAIHEEVARLIARLDAMPISARRPVRTFVVKNRPVGEVRAVLEELLAIGALDAGFDAVEPSSGSPADASLLNPGSGERREVGTNTTLDGTLPGDVPPSPPTSISRQRPSASGGMRGGDARDRPLVLTIDEGTNTLIAVGEPRLLAAVESLLTTLDVRQAQVMLEVMMVTLTEGQTRSLGVELEKLSSYDDAQIRLSSLFGLGVRTGTGDLDGPTDASGFTGVVLSPGDFSIVVRALETINEGRSLSMPRLLVGNNEQASLESVVQQPFASVNASNTVSTTSFGGTQDAGTVVTLRPQIGEGEHLLLEYAVSLSSFLGASSSPTLPPPRQQNRVRAVATIPDGFTVVVGGIELEDRSKSVSQLPILGDIPILGEAFKSRAISNSGSKFYVFIRATLLRARGFEDLKYLSSTYTRELEVDDGWPALEPRILK